MIKKKLNIEFKNISENSLEVYWKIDDLNLLNIEQKKIKFRVEIKKENSKKKFIVVYEGNNTNCSIANLKKNTCYEIRICSIYNNLIGNWSQSQNVKTKKYDFNCIDSIILNEVEKGNEYLNKLYEWSGYNKMELIYRGTRDGSSSVIFHNKCDNQGPTICLFKNEKGNIFGGYTSISWTSPSSGQYKSANDSFIFTLTNIYGTDPTKYPNNDSRYSVCHDPKYGPRFGGGSDLFIADDYLNNYNSDSYIGHSYEDVLKKGCSIFTGDKNNNNHNFKLKELEVFKLSK